MPDLITEIVVDHATGETVERVVEDHRPAIVKAWRPLAIVHALEAMGVAAAIADTVDKVTWTKFCCAAEVPEDDPLLLAALSGVGKTIDDLKRAIV